MRSCDF